MVEEALEQEDRRVIDKFDNFFNIFYPYKFILIRIKNIIKKKIDDLL
jgi:hypothetical protein